MAERAGHGGGAAAGGGAEARGPHTPAEQARAHPGGGHDAPGAVSHGGHGSHASVGFYWMIGIVLAVITAVEVAVFYIPALEPVLVPVLLVLSAAKFVLVVMFFMHLRFDSLVLTGLFMAGLVLAAFMVTALIVLYHFLPRLQG